MTIIQPNKNNNKTNLIISASVVILVVSAVWSIFIYNRVVNLRHENQRQEVLFRQVEVANAELKNNFYGMTDADGFESALDSQRLILEKNPKYLKLTLN
ncbi:MAG TPA: hypothetical protein ENH26_02555 [Candidatus Wolfebacteria bacterium]|nr:hypothetical protein [Candidatus Wolfebacteria bacterium]